MFVEGTGDLQPTDEGGYDYVFIAAVYQGHLALEVINVVLQTLPSFQLYNKEVVVVPLEFLREANWL